MKKYLSMVALALVGALMTGCSSDDNEPQQPANTGNVETLTLTVSLDGEGTRALSNTGVKTFAVDDLIAVVYKNKSGNTVKAVSEPLTVGGSSATFTVTVEDADKEQDVTYIYPASMANTDGSINYAALATQDGTLATLSSNLDLATYTGAWSGTSLPSNVELDNPLAILELTLKDNAGSSTITSGLTQVTVSDGDNTYTVTPTGSNFGTDVIYVAIRPVTVALQYTATDGSYNYTKTATSRTYAAGSMYPLGLRMTQVAIGHALSASAVGEIVGSNGLAYAAAARNYLPTGVSAVAKVCYKNGNNGLALALADEGQMDWSTAISTCAEHTPAITGGTWKLATQDEWNNMITAAGGYTALRNGFEGVGGTNLQSASYWSSTGTIVASYYDFANGGWSAKNKVFDLNVRACLAF